MSPGDKAMRSLRLSIYSREKKKEKKTNTHTPTHTNVDYNNIFTNESCIISYYINVILYYIILLSLIWYILLNV